MNHIAIVHDYLTQRGGAERVVLAMAEAFPDAPIYTALYDPAGTYPEFADLDVRPSRLNGYSSLRRNHRAALPFLASTFERLRIDEGVVLASSSGWAHGVTAPQARKVVYCYTPARWLYLTEQYADTPVRKAAMAVWRRRLRRWDQAAAASADHYLAISTEVQTRIRDIYGIEADLLFPPHTMDPAAPGIARDGVEPGFFLVVSRLMGYKNVDAVVAAMRQLPNERLVVAGDGPMRRRLESAAPPNVTFTGTVSDAELRWLYESCVATVSASHEDFGLVPLEGASFGRPAITLHSGGFLDTVVPGETGLFFPSPEPGAVAAAMTQALQVPWDEARLAAHADRFSKAEFVARLQAAIGALRSRS